MTNLLEETREAVARSGHTPADIVFIGSRESGHECTWQEFEALADTEYDAGYGAQEVASDLEIVFRDGGGMTRSEYDGSESWSYSKPFKRGVERKPIRFLTVNQANAADGGGRVGWDSLSELNKEPNP